MDYCRLSDLSEIVGRTLRFIVPVLLGGAGLAAQAAVFTVGAGSNCQFNTSTGGTVQMAISAAELNPGIDTVAIARNASYTAQALETLNGNLILSGGWTDCSLSARSGNTVLSGSGGAARAVLTVQTIGNVFLERLTLRDGDAGPAEPPGGGIRFSGTGLLRLDAVELIANTAANGGGGIGINTPAGAPAPARLELGPNTRIEQNHALGPGSNGGGIHVSVADLRGMAEGIRIGDNLADGNGGAIYSEGGRITLGSAGPPGMALIDSNIAGGFAGGIFSDGADLVQLVTIHAERPTRIRGNRGQSAGAFYLANGSELRAWDLIVEDNVSLAEGGEAAAVVFLSSSSARFERDLDVGPAPAGALNCAPGLRCNLLQNNRARNLDDTATTQGASVAYMRGHPKGSVSQLRLAGSNVRGNTGGRLVVDSCFPAAAGSCPLTLDLVGSEVSANFTSSGSLFDLRAGTSTTVDLSTISAIAGGNTFALFSRGGELAIQRSILSIELGSAVNDVAVIAGTSYTPAFTIIDDLNFGNPLPPTVMRVDPEFMDAAAGDLRLAADSPAIDYAPTDPAAPLDLDLLPRGIDLPEVGNLHGPIDLGARERPLSAAIFGNGFES